MKIWINHDINKIVYNALKITLYTSFADVPILYTKMK